MLFALYVYKGVNAKYRNISTPLYLYRMMAMYN